MVSYYCKWIENFCDIAKPLFETKKMAIFKISPECLYAIKILKEKIASASLSVPDDHEILILETEASGYSIGAVLSQNGQPLGFYSHKLTDVEKRWPVIEL